MRVVGALSRCRRSTAGRPGTAVRTALSFAAAVLLGACGGGGSCLGQGNQPQQPPQNQPDVKVIESGRPAEKRFTSIETIPENNCTGSSSVTMTVQRTLSFTHTVDLGEEITVHGDGSVTIPGVGQVQVGAALATHYNVSKSTEESITESLEVGAAAGTNIQHRIHYYDLWETGTLRITSGSSTSDHAYSFLRSKGIELISSDPIACTSTPSAPQLVAPVQVAPPNGSTFSNFPRTTTVSWNAVLGAQRYQVEVDYCDPTGCNVSATRLVLTSVSTTSYTFQFVGKQPGQWRVWAVSAANVEGPKSGWWGFRYIV